MNEPVLEPDELDLAAVAFWRGSGLDALLGAVGPYEGPDEFVIEDLSDDEWDRFVAALTE